jgi:uncharacterized phage protein (TIGR01671 family)
MQREIKFRGKRVDTKEWVYGYAVPNEDKTEWYIVESVEPDASYGAEETTMFSPMWYQVIPETVGQYTGLKDKNSQKIYEGDIVNCEKRGAAFYRSVVVYNSIMGRHDVNAMGCMFPMTLDCYEDDISIDGNDYEVIGNIYENPELLKDVSE